MDEDRKGSDGSLDDEPSPVTFSTFGQWIGTLDWGQVARHCLFALVVGVAGAAGSIVLCLVVDAADRFALSHRFVLFALPVLGVLGLLLYKALKIPAHESTDDVVRTFRENRPVSAKLAPGILAGTALTVLGGGSVGKEAGALQMGASLGELVSRPFGLRALHRESRARLNGYAAACGMASCFSALFFSPLGATMFVLELSRFDRTVVHRLPTMLVGAFIGCAIARAAGIGDVIPAVAVPEVSVELLGGCVLVGLACGVAGTAFSWGIKGAKRLLRSRVGNPYLAVFAGGALFAALVFAFGWFGYMGTGDALMGRALAGDVAGWDFAVKLLLTVVALGFGFKGGEIMPMFCIGSLLGCALGAAVGLDAPLLAAAGLAGFFSAASRCPLAAFLIGCEVFGWLAAPYLVVAVAVAFLCGADAGIYGHGAFRGIVRLKNERRS